MQLKQLSLILLIHLPVILSKTIKSSNFHKRSTPEVSYKCRKLISRRIHPDFRSSFTIKEQIFIKQTIKNLPSCKKLSNPQVMINLLYYKNPGMRCVEYHLGQTCLTSFTNRARRLSRDRTKIGGYLFTNLFKKSFNLNSKYRNYVKLYSS